MNRRKKPARKQVSRGTRLAYNAALQNRYAKEIKTLIAEMSEDVEKEITRLFKGPTAREFHAEQKEAAAMDSPWWLIRQSKIDLRVAMDASITSQAKKLTNKLTERFTRLFDKKSKLLAERMVTGAEKTSATNLSSSLKKLSGEVTLKTNFMTEGLREMTSAAVAENVGLIKTIAADYLHDVQSSVMRSITTNTSLTGLIADLRKYKGISDRKATNVALDQTRKVYNMVNKGRMQAVNIKQFEWIHSGGGSEPRKSHIALDGKIFSFDKLPVINQEQVSRGAAPVRGIPGQAINCGCTMTPVTTFDEEEAE